MRRAITVLVLLMSIPAWATTYYMRADGSAANKGAATSCSAAATAMSVTKHNSETFAAGDTITICDSGGVYRGTTLTAPSAGSGGSPITYTNSGSPILNGSTVQGSWTQGAGALSEEPCTGTCIFDSGFETGGSTFTDWTSRVTNGGTVTQSTAHVAHGTYSMALTSGSGTDNRMGVTKTISTLVAGTPIYWRFYLYVPTGSLTASKSNGLFIFAFPDNSANISLTTNSSGNVTAMQYWPNGCAPCSTAVTFAMDTWHYIDVEFLVGTTTGNGGGQVWLDGTSVGSNFTINTTTFTSKTAIHLGNSNFGAFQNAGQTVYFDDFRESSAGPIGAFNAPGVPTTVWYSTVGSCPSAAFVNSVGSLPQGGYGSLTGNQWYCTGTTIYAYGGGSAPTGVEIPSLNYLIDTNGKNYITATGLTLTESLLDNFFCNGSTNCVVTGNTISNAVYAGYGTSGTVGSNAVSNNTISNCGQHGIASWNTGGKVDNGGNTYTGNVISGCDWAMLDGSNGGENIVAGASNDTFSYNYIHDAVALGTIGLNDGISIGWGAATITGINVYGNWIVNIPYGSGIWCGECSGTIKWNYIQNSNLNGILLWGYLTNLKTQVVEYNVLTNNNAGFQIGGSNTTYYALTLANNTFANNLNSVNGWHENVYLQANLNTLTAKNNIFYGTGTAPSHQDWNLGTQSNASIDYNIYQTTGMKKYGGSQVSWATWQSDGFDAHGKDATDPLFTNQSGGVFTLTSSSPAIDAGVNLGSTYQTALYPGSTWPSGVLTANENLYGGGWEIGAYLYAPPKKKISAATWQ